MKKIILLANIGLLSFISFLIPFTANAAEGTCRWVAETTVVSQSGANTSGGCSGEEVEANDNNGFKCTETKPEDSSDFNRTIRYLCCCKPSVLTPSKRPKFIMPEFQISIPGVKLTSSSDISFVGNADGSYMVQIPWIGEYIAGVYKYGLGVAGILAAVVLMASGILWLISRGDASKISQAKELIIGSIIGLIILSSSYIILNQINPNLVTYKPISLGTIPDAGFDIPDSGEVEMSAGQNPYQAGCDAARNGDWSVCRGYGDAMPESLVILDGVYMAPALAEKYQAAKECVKNYHDGNFPFYILVGWRSAIKQIEMKEYWTNEGHPENAATPCCSNHGSGRALDLRIGTPTNWSPMNWAYNESSHLKECMNAQGITAPLTSSPNEPWHWQIPRE